MFIFCSPYLYSLPSIYIFSISKASLSTNRSALKPSLILPTQSGRDAEDKLQHQIDLAREELKNLARQKVRDMARCRGSTEVIEETYDALIEETNNRIEGLTNQLVLVADATNSIIRVNRVSRTIIEVFDDILNKNKLDKNDLRLIIDRIIVYTDHIDVKLRADVDELLSTGTVEHLTHTNVEGIPVNFNSDTKNIKKTTKGFSFVAAQRARNQRDKVFCVNVVSNGSPSRMRIVLLISLGMTTLPRSSILLTIPVAFILINLLVYYLLCASAERRERNCISYT